MLGLPEVSIPEQVGDWEEDEKWGDVETPEEQPVDLVVEHLWQVNIKYLFRKLHILRIGLIGFQLGKFKFRSHF